MANTTPNFTVVKLPPRATHTEMADQAIKQHAVIQSGDLVAIPDLLLLEADANGHDTPRGAVLTRNDGRTVHFFRGLR